jgi:hypothetical protein
MEALARADLEGVHRAALMVSGTLGPEQVRGFSQFSMREMLTYCTPELTGLQEIVEGVGWSDTAVSDAASRLRALETSIGRFHIWAKQPRHAYCEAIIRAAQKGEQDFGDYLIWLRRSELGVIGDKLDPYIAQVLLGMRRIDGELALPGDMKFIRHRREFSLASLSDHQLYEKLEKSARKRKYFDQHPRRGAKPGVEDQLSASDELQAVSFSLRWRITIDWDEVGGLLNDRTARELGQVRAGYSVEEMGKTNYNHFREQLPRIRKAAFDVQRAQNIKIS